MRTKRPKLKTKAQELTTKTPELQRTTPVLKTTTPEQERRPQRSRRSPRGSKIAKHLITKSCEKSAPDAQKWLPGGLWGRPRRPRERPRGSPGRPLGRLIWMKNGLEIPPGRFWELPKLLLSPGGFPRALGKRFLEAPNVLLRALRFQVVFRTALSSKKVPREASGTLKIKVIVWTVSEFRDFHAF